MSPEDFLWTDEATDHLKIKWADGWSAGAIAIWFSGAYYRTLSRNAIMGKVHRLGLPKRVVKEAGTERAPRKPRKPWHAPRPEPTPAPSGQEVSFMDLNEGMCRYIPGTPSELNTMYCGGAVLGVESYCPHHYRMCYQTQRLRPSGALLGAAADDPPSELGGGSDSSGAPPWE